MADIKINEKLVVSQTGTSEPVLASNVDLSSATGIPAAGITGTLGSGITFPNGHVVKTTVNKITNGGTNYNINGSSEIVPATYSTITCTVGNTLLVTFHFLLKAYKSGSSSKRERFGYSNLYQSTSSVAQDATSSFGTKLARTSAGRWQESATGSGNDSIHPTTMSGFFLATATTHYVGITIEGGGSTHISTRLAFDQSGEAIIMNVQELQGDLT